MEKIASFTVDHLRLVPGVYVSRIDQAGGNPITTFDLRMTSPNDEPVMNTAEVHTIEHLAATFITQSCRICRQDHLFWTYGLPHRILSDSCRKLEIQRHRTIIKEMYRFMADFEGEVPGASAKDCGNYLDMNLPMAKYLSEKYLTEVLENITEEQLHYPS